MTTNDVIARIESILYNASRVGASSLGDYHRSKDSQNPNRYAKGFSDGIISVYKDLEDLHDDILDSLDDAIE